MRKKQDGYIGCEKVEERCISFQEKNKLIYKPLKIGEKVYKHGKEFEVYYIQYIEDGFDNYFRFFATINNKTSAIDDIHFYDNEIGKTVFLNRKDSEK